MNYAIFYASKMVWLRLYGLIGVGLFHDVFIYSTGRRENIIFFPFSRNQKVWSNFASIGRRTANLGVWVQRKQRFMTISKKKLSRILFPCQIWNVKEIHWFSHFHLPHISNPVECDIVHSDCWVFHSRFGWSFYQNTFFFSYLFRFRINIIVVVINLLVFPNIKPSSFRVGFFKFKLK